MTHKTGLLAALAAVALTACGPETGAGFGSVTPVTTSATARVSTMEEGAQILSLINQERGKRGLGALSYNASLTRAAQAHADDMAAKGYFSHNSKNGASVGDRVRGAGYGYCFVSENLSTSYPTVQQAVQGWMDSQGHRANILNAKPVDIGIGVAAGGLRVAVFGRPC
ncbi:CAP domain-containing protein [Celeribacter neptunius]|uniref:Cysteine-rich secretory protein family protein n=1 Tax=Celeribacter neptunius TaxID=588602 RepID=A0A1I3WIM3_9RHOB|nr:CAP domain-containing protein [Celeribacter neptunius]SFK07378.1 Cysteine-rich secretory protein family protein [Celeribacter neptunius]